MSKYVKKLQMQSLRRKFEGVQDVIVANIVGMTCKESHELRKSLRDKKINIEVVQNNLARKVFGEMGLPPTDALLQGGSAVIWGGEGIVELAREISEFAKKIEKLQLKGVCLSGETLVGKEEVERVSKLPSRLELIGQIITLFTSPAASVAALAVSPGSQIVGQIKTLAEKETPAA
jgi:large subunit ribosomal protein L10